MNAIAGLNCRSTGVLLASVVFAGSMSLAAQQRPTFRARATLVTVDASVKSGNNPVLGLTPKDFLLTDNGVPQEVESVDVAAIPIDVTIVVDLSGSTRSQITQYRSEVATIGRTLRRDDRLRLIVFSTEVHQVRALEPVGDELLLNDFYTVGYSAVYDGIGAALLRRVDVDRRHLIVAFTDGSDNVSVLTLPMIQNIAKQSESVLHLSGNTVGALTDAAESTGGANHERLWQGTMASSFKRIFDDFRQSYVLRYEPNGVPLPGWHDLKLSLNRKGRFSIHARRGYFVG